MSHVLCFMFYVSYLMCDVAAADHQRNFFDTFAKSRHFDPLDAEKWQSIRREDIVNAVCRK